MIYFIQSPVGHIKIGTTTCLHRRLKQLSTKYGDGLVVLGVMDGSFEVERALHQRFAHLRQTGEWFLSSDELVEFLRVETRPWPESGKPKPIQIFLEQNDHRPLRIIAAQDGISMKSCLEKVCSEWIIRQFETRKLGQFGHPSKSK